MHLCHFKCCRLKSISGQNNGFSHVWLQVTLYLVFIFLFWEIKLGWKCIQLVGLEKSCFSLFALNNRPYYTMLNHSLNFSCLFWSLKLLSWTHYFDLKSNLVYNIKTGVMLNGLPPHYCFLGGWNKQTTQMRIQIHKARPAFDQWLLIQ